MRAAFSARYAAMRASVWGILISLMRLNAERKELIQERGNEEGRGTNVFDLLEIVVVRTKIREVFSSFVKS